MPTGSQVYPQKQPGLTYEPMSLTYQPLTLKEKGLDDLGDIQYRDPLVSQRGRPPRPCT